MGTCEHVNADSLLCAQNANVTNAGQLARPGSPVIARKAVDVHLKQLLCVRGKAPGAGGGHAAGSTWPSSSRGAHDVDFNPFNQTPWATRQKAESNNRRAPCSA